jgi:hypothetical protein
MLLGIRFRVSELAATNKEKRPHRPQGNCDSRKRPKQYKTVARRRHEARPTYFPTAQADSPAPPSSPARLLSPDRADRGILGLPRVPPLGASALSSCRRPPRRRAWGRPGREQRSTLVQIALPLMLDYLVCTTWHLCRRIREWRSPSICAYDCGSKLASAYPSMSHGKWKRKDVIRAYRCKHWMRIYF